MTQASPGFLLHLRLFLEGIEIPVISAGVTATIGSGATATIDIVPDDTLDQILPRTTVHLFYLDCLRFRRRVAVLQLMNSINCYLLEKYLAFHPARQVWVHVLLASTAWIFLIR